MQKLNQSTANQLFVQLNGEQLLLNYRANVPFISSMRMSFINCYADYLNQLISQSIALRQFHSIM